MRYLQYMEWTRKFRSKYFNGMAKPLVKWGITANQLTTLSHLLGLLSCYFLFNNHIVFVVLFCLHLVADGFDGVVARLTKPTLFGDYYDHIGDQIVALLLLLKIYLYLGDYYVLVILGIFLLTNLIYFFSEMKSPIIFVRTGTGVALIFSPLNPALFVNGTYLVSGVFLIYSLAKQIAYYSLERKK